MQLSRIGILLLIVTGALIANSAGAKITVGKSEQIKVEQAPELDLNLFGGGRFHLKDLRGRVVVLNFWATWCIPCRVEISDLNRLNDDLRDQGLTVVGISWDDTEKEIAAFQKQIKLKYRVVLGGESIQSKFGGVPGIPTTYIIDRAGRLRQKIVGATEASEFEPLIKSLLPEKP